MSLFSSVMVGKYFISLNLNLLHDNIITTHLQDRDNRRLKDGITIITSGGMVGEITFTAHESQFSLFLLFYVV
jgi:hypothetical protein